MRVKNYVESEVMFISNISSVKGGFEMSDFDWEINTL